MKSQGGEEIQIEELRREVDQLKQEISVLQSERVQLQETLKNNLIDIIDRNRNEQAIKQYIQTLNFLSNTATEMLGPLSLSEFFKFVSDQLYSVSGGAIISFNEFDHVNHKAVVRELRCTPEEREKVYNLFGRDPEGLEFYFPEEIRGQFTLGGLDLLEGGFRQLVFGQLPDELCQAFEKELSIRSVYAMACSVEDDLMGTVAVLSHDNIIENKNLIESVVNQAALVLKRKRAEEALRESEEKFSAAFRTNPNALVLTYIQDGTIIDVNDTFLSLFDQKREEVIGKTSMSLDMYDQEEREKIVSILHENGRIVNHEVKVRRKNGEELSALASIEVLPFHNGNTMLTTLQDITERKQFEKALKQSEKRYRKLVESANSIIVRWDTNGILRFVNEYTLCFFGYSRSEMIGKNVSMLVPETETTGRDLTHLIDDILANPQKYEQFENENIRKNGEVALISWTNRAITDENGNVVEILAIGNDITERKKAEDALRTEHNILEAVVSNMGVGFVVADKNGNIISMNKAALMIHDFKSEKDKLSRLSQYAEEFELEYPDGGKIPIDKWPLSLALQGKFIKEFQVKLIRHKSDSPRYVSYDTTPIYDGHNKLMLFVITMTDFTDIRERTRALQESEQRYRSLFNNATLGIAHCAVIIDEAGKPVNFKFIQVNDAYSRITGKNETEGKMVTEVFPGIENFSFDYIGSYGKVALGGGELNFETYFEGLEKWFSVYVYSPRMYEFTILFSDITERKKMEESERAKATEIEAILSSIADGVVVYDTDGHIVRSNTAAEGMLKLRNAEKELSLEERVPRRYRVWAEDGRLLDTKEMPAYRASAKAETIRNELFLIEIDGESHWFNMSASPLIVSGKHTGGIISLSDVTRRKQAEENLKSNEAAMEAFFDASPGILNLFDPQLRYLKSDRLTPSYFGLDRNNIVGKSLFDLNPIFAEQFLQPMLKRVLDSGKPISNLVVEGPVPSQHNESGYWSMSYFPVPLPGGQLGLGCMGVDITDNKRSQNILARERELFESIFSNIPVMINIYDPQFKTFKFNNELKQVLGWTEEDAADDFLSKVYPDPEYRQKVIDYMKSLDTGWKEWQLKAKDGTLVDSLWANIGLSSGVSIGIGLDIRQRKQAEAKLRESEERFRLLADNISQIAWIANEKGELIWFNKRWYDYTGMSIEEMQSGGRERIHHPEYSQRVLESYNTSINTGNPWEYTYPLKGKQGEFRWFLARALPIHDKDGKISLWFGTNTDITEQRRVEEALRESQQRFKSIFDNAAIGIVETDHEDHFVNVNDHLCKILGYTREELICKTVHDLTAPEDRDLSDMMNSKVHQKEISVFNYEKHYLKKDGTPLWVSVTINGIHDSEGNYVKSVGTVEDISERKKAEEALMESQEKLKLALENGNIGVWSWNMITNEIEWDERMERIFGIPHGTFGNSYDAFETFVMEEDLPHVRKAIDDALVKNVPYDTVFRIKIKSGEIRHISGKASITRDSEGKPVKMTGVCFDITDMKKGAEQALFRLNEELLRSNKELGQFAYVASHDLQEPLRMVSSFTQLLHDRYAEKLDEDAKEFINYAVDGANRMHALINDLLAFSRIQTRGKEFSAVDMNIMFSNAIYNLKQSIEEKKALVTIDELPVINADGGQMIQLLQNLIGNAIKFCDNYPMVHVSATKKDDAYIFSVKDNGIGIEPQYFERIFQIFQRLQPKDLYGGTGIGLAICKRIVERHGGNIWVESEPGEGSVFYFSIPVSFKSTGI